jgi:carbamoyltransferase
MTTVVGINRVHNASVTIISNGETVLHLENERLSNIKYDAYPFQVLNKIPNYIDSCEYLSIAGVGPLTTVDSFSNNDTYSTFVKHLNKKFNTSPITVHDYWASHHKLHAAQSFYNSGFDTAVCIIKDGMGSEVHFNNNILQEGSYGREQSSVYHASYPDRIELVEQKVNVPFAAEFQLTDKIYLTNCASEALAFQKTSKYFGFHELDAGKVMGMSAYGKHDKNIPQIVIDGKINPILFTYDNDDLRTYRLAVDRFPYLNTDDFQIRANFAYALQEACQRNVLEEIYRIIDKTGCKNICLAGGFFLNCVANNYYRKHLPKDVNIYIEPISSDAGTSMGAAQLSYRYITQDYNKKPQTSLYLGLHHKYANINQLCKKSKVTTVNDTIVAELLTKQKIIAIYQGRSESGPRALGNRSILFDPRVTNAKDIVNTVKQREWFRPFAGTVLHEHCNEYFDMGLLNESPFMMYAVPVTKAFIVPGICHVDNTCRIQTLKKEQNVNYYNLLNEFYKLTGVPILLNTSFNLAGDCIVETVEDAIETFEKSNIDYLYLPKLGYLIEHV